MKTLFSILLVSLVGFSARAKTSYGSECGLIDFADDFEMSLKTSQDLTVKTNLTALQEQQLLHMDPEIKMLTAKEVVAFLIEGSEGGDVYYQSGEFQKKSYDVILYYPGGNPYGAVFKHGAETPVAYIHDSDLVCTDQK